MIRLLIALLFVQSVAAPQGLTLLGVGTSAAGGGGGGTYSLLHTGSGTGSSGGSGNGFSITVSSSTTGSTLMAYFIGGSTLVTSMTDNKSQTWTCPSVTGQTNWTFCYFLNSASGVTSVTPTSSAFATLFGVYSEYSGPTSLAAKTAAWNQIFTTLSWASSSLTPAATSLCIGAFQAANNTVLPTGTSGWTVEVQLNNTNDSAYMGIEDKNTCPTSAVTATGTQASGSTGNPVAAEFVFH